MAFQGRMYSIPPRKVYLCKNTINTSFRHWHSNGRPGFCFQSSPNKLRHQGICSVGSHGLTRANQHSFYNPSRQFEFQGGALLRYGIHDVLARGVQEFTGWDSPEITAEADAQRAQVLGHSEINSSANDYVVVNFYQLVSIEDPQQEVAKHRSFLQGWDIHGRIYINQQGINAQYSGPSMYALAYADWVKEDPRFKDILIQVTSSTGHAFPRLKLRYKCSLVQVDDDVSQLPLLDPSMRAVPLTPSEWKNRLEVRKNLETELDEISIPRNTGISQGRKILLLDVRNGYEWDVGHFQGARRPHLDCFKSTTFVSSGTKMNVLDPLVGVNKETIDVMMYCTGGIRCDIYSIILRQRGFQNLYTLKGGVANYLKEEGPSRWIGNLFVFDSRLSVSPNTYKPMDATEKDTQEMCSCYRDNKRDEAFLAVDDSTFGKCHACGSHLSQMRHRNCANLDCNRLILSCPKCVEAFKGCCSMACTCAYRLRPVLPSLQPYERWHKYRDSKYKM